jgi:hypothetical protein
MRGVKESTSQSDTNSLICKSTEESNQNAVDGSGSCVAARKERGSYGLMN